MPIDTYRVQVELLGEVFSVRDDSAGEEVRVISAFLSEQIDALKARYPALSAKKLAVLAAFHLADELLRVRKDYEALISILDKQ